MRWTSTLATAGLAELAAHFLSVGWGFMVLVGGFCAVASLLRVTSAKVSGTEARLNGHITATAPAVNFVANGGSVGGSVTVNGNHHVTGSHTVDNGISYNNGISGDTGNLTGQFVAFNTNATNGMTTPKLNLASGLTMPNGSPGAVGAPPSGTGGPAAYAGNFFAGSGASTWAIGVTNAINQIHGILSADGITN